jgi:histidinol-phosphate aminotransferase
MIPILARTNGLTGIPVPVTPDGDADADALIATGARIIYLCTPNNPTGTAHRRATVERVIDRAPGVVIIDEAYAEFADDTFTAEVIAHPHVLATRTLSKSFGLAGLRIGYGVANATLIDEVVKSRGPYKVNAFAETAATAALTDDREWMKSIVAETKTVRARFAGELRARGFSPFPSQGNFVCVPVRDARSSVARLSERGIAVRGFSKLAVIGDVLRIGLAPWPVLERVLDALPGAVT